MPSTKQPYLPHAGQSDSTKGLSDSERFPTLPVATPLFAGRRGAVPKRRFQRGTFRKEHGRYYSLFYRDALAADGSTTSKLTRFNLGKVGEISRLSARREHDRLAQQINRERGSVPTAPKGESFADVAKIYMTEIASQHSMSTVRQRQSHLNAHLLPRLGSMSLMALDVPTLQRFVNELSPKISRKSVMNILGTLDAILTCAKRFGIRTLELPERALTIGGDRNGIEAVYFKPDEVKRIIAAAREPYRTMFILLSETGLRAGELFGLTVGDIDFENLTICPRRQADDRTRTLRELKTKGSRTPVPITSETASLLRTYVGPRLQANPQGLLFTNRTGRPCKRANVVKFGLRPILNRMGLPTYRAGLHAFRHGLGTTLANLGVSPAVVQKTLRHTDVKTTLRFYVHADMEAQRSALAKLQSLQKD